jgi:hypothetical protein
MVNPLEISLSIPIEVFSPEPNQAYQRSGEPPVQRALRRKVSLKSLQRMCSLFGNGRP